MDKALEGVRIGVSTRLMVVVPGETAEKIGRVTIGFEEFDPEGRPVFVLGHSTSGYNWSSYHESNGTVMIGVENHHVFRGLAKSRWPSFRISDAESVEQIGDRRWKIVMPFNMKPPIRRGQGQTRKPPVDRAPGPEDRKPPEYLPDMRPGGARKSTSAETSQSNSNSQDMLGAPGGTILESGILEGSVAAQDQLAARFDFDLNLTPRETEIALARAIVNRAVTLDPRLSLCVNDIGHLRVTRDL